MRNKNRKSVKVFLLLNNSLIVKSSVFLSLVFPPEPSFYLCSVLISPFISLSSVNAEYPLLIYVGEKHFKLGDVSHHFDF